MNKLIPADRFDAAARRLAKYKFRRVVEKYGQMTLYEAYEINRRACVPWAWVKLAKRLWARGHVIIDENTREILRRPNLEESLAGQLVRGPCK